MISRLTLRCCFLLAVETMRVTVWWCHLVGEYTTVDTRALSLNYNNWWPQHCQWQVVGHVVINYLSITVWSVWQCSKLMTVQHKLLICKQDSAEVTGISYWSCSFIVQIVVLSDACCIGSDACCIGLVGLCFLFLHHCDLVNKYFI